MDKSEHLKKACELLASLTDNFIAIEDTGDEEAIAKGDCIRDELDYLWYKKLTKDEILFLQSGAYREERRKMTYGELERKSSGRIHHKAVIVTNDGASHEGYFQPFDDQKAYLTSLDGKGAGSIPLEDIKSIEFPDN